MIKKRTRPQPRVREEWSEDDGPNTNEAVGEEKASLSDLLELQKLRKSRQGIDAQKLVRGDAKKKRKKEKEEVGGLRPGAVSEQDEDEEDESAKLSRARIAVRVGNFTGQTNALDVDKHMMAYIESNLKKPTPSDAEGSTSTGAQQDLYDQVADKWKDSQQKAKQDGNVTNSAKMLTAIPEVDLGIDARLKNIEDTEKARRAVSQGDGRSKQINPDEEHLVAQRFYRPNFRQKSDAEILRDAKMEAMGVSPHEREDRNAKERHQTATDELVMERFKKRLRK